MSHRVLVVDDEKHILEVIGDALRDEPYTVITTDSVEEALRTMKEDPVDVIISDEIMPVMSGSELLEEVRYKYPDTIRILFTAYPTLKDATAAVDAGRIFNFLTKPFNIIDLAVSIRQALRYKDLLAASKSLIELAQSQHDLLEDIKKGCPGTIPVEKDDTGTMIIHEKDFLDWDLLTRKIDELIRARKKVADFLKRLDAGHLRR